MEFHNPGYFLKPGMFATVELDGGDVGLRTAGAGHGGVAERGKEHGVRRAGGWKVRAAHVTLGPRAENNTYQVLSGLEEGERGRDFRPVHARFGKPVARGDPEDAGSAMRARRRNARIIAHRARCQGGNPAYRRRPTPTAYICPMPEHASIKYDHPGKCPICGMTLIPAPEMRTRTARHRPSARRRHEPPTTSRSMLARIIDFSLRNKFIVLLGTIALTLAGIFAVRNIPLDAIPDLSDVQVIIYTEWPGQAPQIVQDQVTYPITTKMLSVPRAKVVRGYSFYGFSFVYVIFEDGTDPYWARSRVLEYLSGLSGSLPKASRPPSGRMRPASAGRSCIRSTRRSATWPSCVRCRTGI